MRRLLPFLIAFLLLAPGCSDDDTPDPAPTVTSDSSARAATPSLDDLLDSFDRRPVEHLAPPGPCAPLHTGPRMSVGDEANFGSCATWDDAWEDEYGFVVTIDYFAADPPESFAYLLPAGSSGITLPTADQPDTCERRNFHLQLFVLLPTGSLPLDSLARETDPIEGSPCE